MPEISQAFDNAPTDQRLARLQPGFGDHLQDMIQDVPGLGVRSGYRDAQEQAQLWQAALQKYGSPEVARRWVAPPGTSNHNKGLAADLSFSGPQAIAAAHAQAPNYGLTFPLGNENWHIEPQGIRSQGAQPMQAVASLAPPAAQPAANPQAPSAPPPSGPYAALAATPSIPTPPPSSSPYAALAAALSAAPSEILAQPIPQAVGVKQNFAQPMRDPVALAKALTQGLAGNLTLA